MQDLDRRSVMRRAQACFRQLQGFMVSDARLRLMSAIIACIAYVSYTSTASAAGATGSQAPAKPVPVSQIFTFLFLMLGPFKILGPFAKITQRADPGLARRIALRATLFSSIALLIAALLGETFLSKYRIPLPVLALAGGILLFLVALQAILQQFTPSSLQGDEVTAPTLNMAITPLALMARDILRFLGVFLQILGAVLSIIQVALGLQIINSSLKRLWGL
jgi:multiple antibiotic resistance protein